MIMADEQAWVPPPPPPPLPPPPPPPPPPRPYGEGAGREQHGCDAQHARKQVRHRFLERLGPSGESGHNRQQREGDRQEPLRFLVEVVRSFRRLFESGLSKGHEHAS